MTSQEKALRDFALFAAKLKGDEKSEAQTFLFHLRAAYGMKEDEDTLAFLLGLNRELAHKEAKGVQLTPPGLPVSAGEAEEFMSKDCVTVPDGERGEE
jgi:hypothetical protein